MKKPIRIMPLCIAAMIGYFVGGLLPDYKHGPTTELTLPTPSKPLIPLRNTLFCRAIVGSALEAPSTPGMVRGLKGARGRVFKDTDELAIEVKENKLHFLTAASFKAGTTSDDSPFDVITNTNDQLVAVDSDVGTFGPILNLFSLNRATGIAIWSKLRAQDWLTGNPDVQSYLLTCEAR